jgi:hypothetical protein
MARDRPYYLDSDRKDGLEIWFGTRKVAHFAVKGERR